MPAPPQVTLDIALRLHDIQRQFMIRLVPERDAHPWSLFWHPDHNGEVLTSAGARHLRLPYDKGLDRALRKLNVEGWQYAPWTLSDPKGIPDLQFKGGFDDLVLLPLDSGDDLCRSIRRFVWTDFDHVDARDENDDLVLTLTELGARILGGRLAITPGIPQPRYEPHPQ